MIEGVSLNIAYFLLPGKSREVYVIAFRKFEEALRTYGRSLELRIVRTDHELTLIQAMLYIIPGIPHRGCHFHFTQYGVKCKALGWPRLTRRTHE